MPKKKKGEEAFVASEFKGNVRRSLSVAPEDMANLQEAEVAAEEWHEVLKSEGLGHHIFESGGTFVESPAFELGIGAVTAINVIVIGVELDLRDNTDPLVWLAFESFFAVVWILECSTKLLVLRCRYFADAWNLVDFFLAGVSIFDAWILPNLSVVVFDLSFTRLLRFLRLLKLIKVMRASRNLWLLVQGFLQSLSALNWVFLLAGFLIYSFAILLRMAVDCSETYSSWSDCDQFVGTVPKTMYTLFQIITLESWSMSIGRPIITKQPVMFFVFLLYIFLTTFGLLNIIVGVIVENTLNVASQNLDLQKKRMQRQLLRDLEILKSLFEAADTDGSGTLDKEEFIEIIAVPEVRNTLQRMEVPVDDPETLFEFLDEEEKGEMPFSKFTEGVLNVRGAPTNLDMKQMMIRVKELAKCQRSCISGHEAAKEMVFELVDQVKELKKERRECRRVLSSQTPEESLRSTGNENSARNLLRPNRFPVPVVGVPVNSERERYPGIVSATHVSLSLGKASTAADHEPVKKAVISNSPMPDA
eukprot:TRINITY_DN7190_c0_g2_i2.p1 TRINITY_DN7190_c0_g2~~TRINITY_DN7190_c0_g2_i2.p1  ORF type:complete len:532 (-),score=118.65 TRINITY_DN7190_c0_g2_i2:92-1687(-)